MAKQQVYKLNELGFIGRGKSKNRPRNDPILYGGKYPFFQTGDVKEAELYLRYYSQTYNEVGLAQSKLWQPGTLCITIAANIAETAILAIPGCFPDSIVGFIADPNKTDVRYIKYHIDTIKLKMQNVSKGTTQDNLSLDKLLSFDFKVPSLEYQRRIASILSSYDDLIENNTRRIAILEEMARRIYEEWFIHFRFPGHEKVKMVDSELGKIPEGWEVCQLVNVIELAYGKALKTEDRKAGNFPVYGSSGIVGNHSDYLVEGPGIIVGRKGNVGSVHWSDKSFFPIDTVFYIKTNLSLYYLFFNLKRQNFINNDAAVPGLNRNQAYALPFIKPSDVLIGLFNKICEPIFGLLRVLTIKNTNLRTTRDFLLPKLISGEIDVSKLPEPEEATT